MHLELRVDRPGEQLRPSQVDADHAAGGHDRPPYLAAWRTPQAPPEYKLYRTRPRLPGRGRDDGSLLDELRERAARTSARRKRDHRRPRGQVARARARRRGSALSLVLFLISAQINQDQVSDRRAGRSSPAAASGSSSRRRPSSSAPTSAPQGTQGARRDAPSGPSRVGLDPAPARRRRPQRQALDPARHGRRHPRPRPQQDQRRLRVRRRRAHDHRRSSSTSGIDVNHVFEVNFDELPRAHRRDGRDRLHRRLRRLADQRRLQERRLHAAPAARARRTSTASRRSPSRARATTRATRSENDLTRARRQQKIISGDEVARASALGGFVRLPLISWNAPEDAADRHGRPGAAGLRVGRALSGSAADRGAQALGRRTLPDGGAGLTSRTPRSRPTCGASCDGLVLLRGGRRRGLRVRLLDVGSSVSDDERRGRGRGRLGRPWTLGRRVLSAPSLRRALELAVAAPGAVVGVVEALALEVDRDGVEDALDRRLAASRSSVTGSSVIFCMTSNWWPVLAAVLVDRHGTPQYRSAKRRLPRPHRLRCRACPTTP